MVTGPRVVAVGFDGSPDADAAVRWAGALAAALGARLRIVHAVGLLEHAGMAHLAPHEDRARRLAVESGMDATRVEWKVADGEPCAVLRREAHEGDGAELVVVGTRGAGAHPGTMLGSTSMELAERCPVPLVIVPRGPGGSPRA